MLQRKVELFNNQEQAANRIEELKRTGFHDADMFLFCKGENRIDNIQGTLETLADDKPTAHTSLWERFRTLLGAREEFQAIFEKMGLDEGLSEDYSAAVERGKILLVVVSEKL